jgi:hypothetical protein
VSAGPPLRIYPVIILRAALCQHAVHTYTLQSQRERERYASKWSMTVSLLPFFTSGSTMESAPLQYNLILPVVLQYLSRVLQPASKTEKGTFASADDDAHSLPRGGELEHVQLFVSNFFT